MILENLKTAGVQQAHKEDRITFTALTPWPGDLVCAEGRYLEGETEKRAAIFIGPEFGTVQRADLVAAAREAGDAGFDVLIACAFNYEAHATEFSKLGRIPVLKARMNADLHMAEDLKNTGKGNLFVIFGEPDIDLLPEKDGKLRVKVNGVDVFKPQTGEVVSDGADGIACWFIDTDYNEESFFVRHAYFLGANDPYSALKTTLKAEIDAEAWATLHSDTSRPFDKPKKGRIAVKVINHLGDEVMKVFRVERELIRIASNGLRKMQARQVHDRMREVSTDDRRIRSSCVRSPACGFKHHDARLSHCLGEISVRRRRSGSRLVARCGRDTNLAIMQPDLSSWNSRPSRGTERSIWRSCRTLPTSLPLANECERCSHFAAHAREGSSAAET